MKLICHSLLLGFVLYNSLLLAAPIILNLGIDSSNTPDLAVQRTIDAILTDLRPPLSFEQQQLFDVLSVTVDPAISTNMAKEVRVAISAKSASTETTIVSRLPTGMDLSAIGQRLSALRQGSLTASWQQMASTNETDIAFNHVLPGDLMAQRWNMFFNANTGNLQQTETSTEAGFNNNTDRYMLGSDYRLMNHLFIGMAGTLVKSVSDLDNQAGSMQVQETSFTGYGTYYPADNWYVEASASYGFRQFDLERNLNIAINVLNINQVAKSNPEGKVSALHVSAGYERQWFNSINMTIASAINYFRATIESFQEQGEGGLNLSVDSQDIRGLRLNATISINRAFNQAWGVIIPQLQIGLVRDTQASQQAITARFVHDPGQNKFSFDTQAPDNQYLDMSASAVMILPGGSSGFLQYQRLGFIDNIRQSHITIGARIEF